MKLVNTYKTGWHHWARLDGDEIVELYTGHYSSDKLGDFYNDWNGKYGAECKYTRVYLKDTGFAPMGGFVFQARMRYTGRKGTQNSDHAKFECPENGVTLTMAAGDFSEVIKKVFAGEVKIVDGCIEGNWKFVRKGSSNFIQLLEE